MWLIPSLWAQSPDEYQVKAAFLYNFAKFVEWPAQSFKTANDPIVICVLGKDPFGNVLDEPMKGTEADGRQIVVRRTSDVRQASACNILFISSSERKRLTSVLAAARACGILTVSDMEDFAAQGGVINLKLENGRVRFEINPDAAERSGLRISSKLLSLAQIVRAGRAQAK
jgi:hypothetical protein